MHDLIELSSFEVPILSGTLILEFWEGRIGLDFRRGNPEGERVAVCFQSGFLKSSKVYSVVKLFSAFTGRRRPWQPKASIPRLPLPFQNKRRIKK